MEFPQQVVTEITVPNNVPFQPGYDVIGIGTQLPPAVIAAGYPAAILFYSSSYDPLLTTPQIKYQFIADQGGTIYFGYGLVDNASVSEAETIVTYEGHGFVGTAAQSTFDYVDADVLTADVSTIQQLAANTSFMYRGTELQDLLDAIQSQVNTQAPLGLVAFGTIQEPAGGWTATGAVRVGLFYIGANLTVGRTYRFVCNGVSLNPSAANGSVSLDIHYTVNGTVPSATPGGTTAVFASDQRAIPQFYDTVMINRPFTPLVSAQWNFLAVLNNTRTSHPPNATARILDLLTAEIVIEDIGPALPNTMQTVFVPPPPAPTPYTVIQFSTASRAFNGNGSLNNNNAEMYMGQSPFAPNGVQYSDFFFTGSGPGTLAYVNATGALTSELTQLLLEFTLRHSYYSSGCTIRLGWTDTGGYHFLFDFSVGAPVINVAVNLLPSALLKTAICNGTFQNFNLAGNSNPGFRPPAGNYNYYGYCDGAGQALKPRITIRWAT